MIERSDLRVGGLLLFGGLLLHLNKLRVWYASRGP